MFFLPGQILSQKLISAWVLLFFVFLAQASFLEFFQSQKNLSYFVFSAGLFLMGLSFLPRDQTKLFFILCCLSFVSQFLFRSNWQDSFAGRLARYEVVIQKNLELKPERSVYLVRLQKRHWPFSSDVSGEAQIVFGESCPIQENDMVNLTTKFKPFRFYANDGVFDYKRFMERRGILASAFISNCDDVVVAKRGTLSFSQNLTRKWIDRLSQDASLKHAEVILALTLGRSWRDPQKKQMLRGSGLSHLFVISGTHIGFLAAFIYFLSGFILNRCPKIYFFVSRQKLQAFFVMLILGSYFLLVMPSSSVDRAISTVVILSLFGVLDLKIRTPQLILLVACFGLFSNPWLFYDISFQMTFLCVTLLFLVRDFLHSKFTFPIKEWSFKKLLYVLSFVFLMQIFLAPYLLWRFSYFSVASIFNNLWGTLYFGFVVIPLCFLSLVANFFSDLPVFIKLADQSLGLFFQILAFVFQIDFFSYENSLSLGFVIFSYAFLAEVFVWKNKRRRLVWKRRVALIFLFCLFVIWKTRPQNSLIITQIDVGQGDAILIQTRQENILIDTGGNHYFDIAERVLIPFLKSRGISVLDKVILTHPDEDHFGAFEGLSAKIPIKDLYVSQAFKGLREPLWKNAKTIENELVTSLLDAGQLHFLQPPLSNFSSDNDRSLLVRLEMPELKILFTGDAGIAVEDWLIRDHASFLKADILKVGHHGSTSSTSKLFLKKVSPKLALIGVGRPSPFGHPHPCVMQNLHDQKIEIYRTDYHGQIDVEFNSAGKIKVMTKLEDFKNSSLDREENLRCLN